MQNGSKPPNVIDLKNRRGQVLKKKWGGSSPKGPKNKGFGSGPGFWAYVQVILLLAVVAYMTSLCSGS